MKYIRIQYKNNTDFITIGEYTRVEVELEELEVSE